MNKKGNAIIGFNNTLIILNIRKKINRSYACIKEANTLKGKDIAILNISNIIIILARSIWSADKVAPNILSTLKYNMLPTIKVIKPITEYIAKNNPFNSDSDFLSPIARFLDTYRTIVLPRPISNTLKYATSEPINEYNPNSDCPKSLIITGVYPSPTIKPANIFTYDKIAPIFN